MPQPHHTIYTLVSMWSAWPLDKSWHLWAAITSYTYLPSSALTASRCALCVLRLLSEHIDLKNNTHVYKAQIIRENKQESRAVAGKPLDARAVVNFDRYRVCRQLFVILLVAVHMANT